MRTVPRIALLLALFSFTTLAPGQQSTSSSTQATQFLQESLAALVGNTSVTDVTVSGTARRIAGSDDETGTGVFKALSGTGSRMDLSFPSGPRIQVYSTSVDGPAGNWSGPDSVMHSVALHNLWTNHSWFFPAFTLASFLNSQNSSVVYVGQETKDNQAVIHLSASLISPEASAKTAKFIRHMSQTEIYLDAVSLLPVAISYNTHPDNNAALDIPVEIRFSDYETQSGVQMPLHVQKFLNYSLVLDLQFQSTTFNSGLSAANFTVAAGQ